MKENILDVVAQLIKLKKIEKAQMELARLGPEFFKNTELLFIPF